jgi:hypothetical protein
MNMYRYYLLPSGATVAVCQPEHRYSHVGDLLTTRTFVRVVGKRYDGSIGEFGLAADVLAQATEVSESIAALRLPQLVRTLETPDQADRMSVMEQMEQAGNQRAESVDARVLV